MGKTILSIEGNKFLLNNALTYSEVAECAYKGTLMNARFIQAVFDDRQEPGRFNRFGRTFDPEKNTLDLIASLPAWYDKGLRCITIGLQGGGPCFTTPNDTIINHPYIEVQGQWVLDEAYADRMLKVLAAADRLGMVVILSCFYPGQVRAFTNGRQIVESLASVCGIIHDSGYKNVIVEICNEFDLCRDNPLIGTEEGMCGLITMAQKFLNMATPVGSSLSGGCLSQKVAQVSDVVLIHGNGCGPEDYHGLLEKAKAMANGKPVLCNEDSPCIANMLVSMDLGVGWGYYNNMTKQEPPTDWAITQGQDEFFAQRMAMKLGISPQISDFEEKCHIDKYYLQGVNQQVHEGHIFLRLASLFPETIQGVDFYRNGTWIYRAYCEPFAVNHRSNWHQVGTPAQAGDLFSARVVLVNGRVYELEAALANLV